ncbi:MAG: DUF554 domain-containing protein [Candidatus Zixiibacteriota bacterium]
MKGTLVNTTTVIVGSGIGLWVGHRLPENIKRIVLHAMGLVTILLGIQMALKTESVLILIGSLVLGGITGELLKIEEALEKVGEYLKKKVKSESGNFVLGFVSASLLFCVGPMTVVGSLEDGLFGKADLLYIKSVLDGFASLILSSGLGIGVLFSFLTVLIFQGSLTLLGNQLEFILREDIITEMSAAGGLLIVGIGLQLLDIKKIRVANLLPTLVYAVILAYLKGYI